MMSKIQTHLKKVSDSNNFNILLACETGSRAWGFPSPDSDYDIRIIYSHELDWYLTLSESKDYINLMLEDNLIDISGWDIRKALRLLLKSNAALIERIQSPMVYQQNTDFVKDINLLADQAYSKVAVMHHYLSLTKKKYSTLTETSNYRLKDFFYALRSSLVCLWILEKEDKPPMHIQEILEDISISSTHETRINELIHLKSKKSESYLHTGESELISLVSEIINECVATFSTLPSKKGNVADFNKIFKKYIR